MKRIISVFVSLFVFLSVFSCVFSANGIFDSGKLTKELHSKIYYMESLDEGTVFFEKNADK